MYFNRGSKVFFLLVGMISVLSLVYVSPVGNYIQGLVDSDQYTMTLNSGAISDIIENPSFEDDLDDQSWTFESIEPTVKSDGNSDLQDSNLGWPTHGSESMRIFGTGVLPVDGSANLYQEIDLTSDADHILIDLYVASRQDSGGFRVNLCKDDLSDPVAYVTGLNCVSYPDTSPIGSYGKHELRLNIPQTFRGSTVRLELTNSYYSGEIVQGYFDNVRVMGEQV